MEPSLNLSAKLKGKKEEKLAGVENTQTSTQGSEICACEFQKP